MTLPSIGIIGNVGIDGTVSVLEKLKCEFDRLGLEVLPRIVVEGVEVDRTIERNLIVHESTDGFVPLLQQSAQRLRVAEVDRIILACNTLHMLERDIRIALGSQSHLFCSVQDAVSQYVHHHNIQRIGIVGTSCTCRMFASSNIPILHPESSLQDELNQSIVRIVTQSSVEKEVVHVQRAIDNLHAQGADAILIACSDLEQCTLHTHGIPIAHSMQLLARYAISSSKV